MPSRCDLTLIDVALPEGGNATNIKVKGKGRSEYFVYDNIINDWRVFSQRILLGDHPGFDGSDTPGVNIGNRSGNAEQQIYATAIGTSAGQNSQKTNAIAIGYEAGYSSQGSNAIAIGYRAGNILQGSNSIAIGYLAGTTQVSNSIVLNGGSNGINVAQSGFYVNPIRGADISQSVLWYDTATSELRYTGSSQRYKYDIIPFEKPTATLYQLEPREFKYKLSGSQDIGLIAEEVFNIDPSLVYLSQGEPEGIQWNIITIYLLQEIKKLRNRIQALKEKKHLFTARATGFT